VVGEPGALAQAGEEHLVERQAGDERRLALRPDDADTPLRRADRDRPDGGAVRQVDADRRRPGQRPGDRGAVLRAQRLLEGRVARDRARSLLRRAQLVLVGGERGAQTGLQPGIRRGSYAALRDGPERPPCRRQRQQRQHDEIRRELEAEAADVSDCQGSPSDCR
jgi:hypothetical protein